MVQPPRFLCGANWDLAACPSPKPSRLAADAPERMPSRTRFSMKQRGTPTHDHPAQTRQSDVNIQSTVNGARQAARRS
jgi:hypothetical protein